MGIKSTLRHSLRLAVTARAAPFVFYILVMAASSYLDARGFEVRWLYTLRARGAALLLFLLRHQYSELDWPPAISLRTLLLSILTGVAVLLCWIHLDQSWMLLGPAMGYDPRMADGRLNIPLVAMRLAGAVLVVPLMEEIFWRSFLMRWLDRADFLELSPERVSLKALFLSSLLFASEHTFWFAGLVAGLAYGWLYLRTRNLWPPLIAHAVTNALLGAWVLYGGNWAYW